MVTAAAGARARACVRVRVREYMRACVMCFDVFAIYDNII